MLEGSEFQTVVAAMLKLREAKTVRTGGTDRRLVLAERKDRDDNLANKSAAVCQERRCVAMGLSVA